ncbi:MAG: hypothetical protein K2J95_07300 [Lachnospiraceae bacterium]|nr:hypothetical protein [Lachnospiraceae bacterium]
MHPWYVAIIKLINFLGLFICFIILIIMLIRAKKHHKATRIIELLLSLDIILFAYSFIFVLSHSTYYRYNDWAILNSDINSVINKYGVFDVGSIQEGKAGCVGYYIYTDNVWIMPDHLDHYYWIFFDENGTVYRVEDSLPPGG